MTIQEIRELAAHAAKRTAPENYSVEFEGQYYKKGNHNAMNITFIDWKLEEVEEWLDKMFEAGMLEHYEK